MSLSGFVSTPVGDFTRRFLRTYPPAEKPAGPTLYLPFRDGDLVVVRKDEESARLLRDDISVDAATLQSLLPKGENAMLYLKKSLQLAPHNELIETKLAEVRKKVRNNVLVFNLKQKFQKKNYGYQKKVG